MSCTTTGDIAPKTGDLVYQLPPDLNPGVPFGPPLQFVRRYQSAYAPPATNYRTAMGPRWTHNFQSWIDRSGTTAIVHLPSGRDVLFTYSNTSGGFDYYTPQAGFHAIYFRQATASPNHWELKSLTGEKYVYDWASPVGKLIEIDDSLATPNKLTIAYLASGSNKGQIDTVLDAAAHKRFQFSYTSGEVTTINYQTGSSSTFTTRAALTISYTSTNPTTVKIAGSTIQTMSYASNFLTGVFDASGNHIIDITPVTATSAMTARIQVGEGGLGYEFNSGNASCLGQTLLFFNLANATSCATDTDCGSTLKCGGKTGSGATGRCNRAARCLTISSPSEDTITTVAPISPCTGSCAPIAQYSWNATTLDLKGVKRATGNWTSYERDANGMIATMAEGDTDDDPTNGGGIDTWFFYDTSFPGRVSERRSRSSLYSDNSICTKTSATNGCKQTVYTWSTDGLLSSRQDKGYTLDGSAGVVTFTYTTGFAHNTKGQLTQIDGPLSGSNDVTNYGYWSSSDVLKDGYLNTIQRKRDTANFLTTTLDTYDNFGNAQSTQAPDGTFTCRTWDAKQNYLSQVREAMNGQTSCTTSNGLDLTTSYVRDTWLRLTKTTNPIGDCEHREYDSYGRLQKTKPRDDCVATNSGNTVVDTYDAAAGFLTTIEFQNSSSTVTKRAKQGYLDGDQIGTIQNPVSLYSRTFSYYSDAQQDLLTFENGFGQTEEVWDAENRETSRHRFTDASTHRDWTFGYPSLSPSRIAKSVTDPASKSVTTNYDDLDRKASIVSPDSGTTLYVYDAASRIVTMKDGYLSANEVDATFTYDNLGRILTKDDNAESCSGSNPVEVQYTYDALPTGVSCPTGATCNRENGRLAYVKEVLGCTSSSPFHLDQETFYGYNDNGRLISEYIDDTGGRTAPQSYTWDKNGSLTQVTPPSGASMTYTLGSVNSNSDANLITTIARTVSGTPTTLISGVLWAPFGPPIQYDHANMIGGSIIRATLAWNLGYRATSIDYSTASGATHKTHIAYTEDEKGRYTQKLYTNVNTGVLSDYLQYDWYDRPVCDATVSGTCPTAGSTLKSNVSISGASGYNSSNDRIDFYHQDPSFGSYLYSVVYNAGKDQIDFVTQSGLSTETNYAWDGRGSRTFDVDTVDGTNARRDYTYDGRRRVRTITGHVLQFGSYLPYSVTYAFDYRDRLVSRQWVVNAVTQSQQFFYYDIGDRLIETSIAYPGISYSIVYDFYWLGNRPVAYWSVDAGGATARYFTHADESNRVLEVFSWPSSGDAIDLWSLNPDIFGWDRIASGTIFQPFRLNDAYIDDATQVNYLSGGTSVPDHPQLLIEHGVHYDPMTETFLQRLGAFPQEPYALAGHNPPSVMADYLELTSSDSTRVPRGGGPNVSLPPDQTHGLLYVGEYLTASGASTGSTAPSSVPPPQCKTVTCGGHDVGTVFGQPTSISNENCSDVSVFGINPYNLQDTYERCTKFDAATDTSLNLHVVTYDCKACLDHVYECLVSYCLSWDTDPSKGDPCYHAATGLHDVAIQTCPEQLVAFPGAPNL